MTCPYGIFGNHRLRWPRRWMSSSRRITHAGGHGAGYLTTLLVNLLWFGQVIATAEALLLAGAQGSTSTSCARH